MERFKHCVVLGKRDHDMVGRVREYDPALSILWDCKEKVYKIVRHYGRPKPYLAMVVQRDQLDGRIMRKLWQGDLQRRRLEDFIRELEESEDAADQRKARELSNKTESITLDRYDRMVGIPHYALGGIPA